jgi:hypothetical protein
MLGWLTVEYQDCITNASCDVERNRILLMKAWRPGLRNITIPRHCPNQVCNICVGHFSFQRQGFAKRAHHVADLETMMSCQERHWSPAARAVDMAQGVVTGSQPQVNKLSELSETEVEAWRTSRTMVQ